MTPQAIVKVRFCEEAEFAGVRYIVRTKQGKPDRLWYVEVQYELAMDSLTNPGPRFRENFQKADKFVKDCFPRAWVTSGGPGNRTFGFPGQDVAAIVADLELGPDCLASNDSAAIRIARDLHDRHAFNELPTVGRPLACSLTALPIGTVAMTCTGSGKRGPRRTTFGFS
ncbi:hypothetical protein AYO44_07560 [Planctomycetaceae bacterium SCGC AG-212-F19]|nr:hypothetical protein AYO44_07560 [Planctomycetaceae bacterium SCGC AG-212-F19]